jgi:hypothetical protein
MAAAGQVCDANEFEAQDGLASGGNTLSLI